MFYLYNAKDSHKYAIKVQEIGLNNIKLINPNFNLITTFNQKYYKNHLFLDQILKNKCLSFNLLPNDYNYESNAQIYYWGLINSNIGGDFCAQLGGKLVNVHMLSKRKSLKIKNFLFHSRGWGCGGLHWRGWRTHPPSSRVEHFLKEIVF